MKYFGEIAADAAWRPMRPGIERFDAILHALSPGRARWFPDGQQHEIVIGAITVDVTVTTLADKINPNLSSAPLLTGLLRALGEPDGYAEQIAQNIVLWRAPAPSQLAATALQQNYLATGLTYGPPATPFATLSQLTNVPGMTPALFGRLASHLSLFQTNDPDPVTTDPIARQAIQFANAKGAPASNYGGAPVISIFACARGTATLCRHAVVSIPGLGSSMQFQMKQLGDGRE